MSIVRSPRDILTLKRESQFLYNYSHSLAHTQNAQAGFLERTHTHMLCVQKRKEKRREERRREGKRREGGREGKRREEKGEEKGSDRNTPRLVGSG